MIQQKNVIKILAGILLSPSLISISGFFPNQLAQSYSESFEISLNFPGSPVYYGAPSRTIGGGVRGDDCIADDSPPLSALIPSNNVWTTISEKPNFLWYIPKTKAEKAEFALLDAENNEVYTKELTLTEQNTGTIIEESLPDNISLETGVYTWQFSLVCNSQRRSGDIYIEGWVEKVDFQDREEQLNQLKTNLQKAGQDHLKQAQAYLDAEIFNESISLLAQMRCEHQEEWEGLLTWMDLAELTTDSIAQCAAEDNQTGGSR